MSRAWLLGFALCSAACASGASVDTAAQWRERLHAAMFENVATRDQRDRLSRLMMDAVAGADIERMDLTQVQAAFGHGNACQSSSLCAEQGFNDEDVYYTIGVATDASIKQLPTLIIGYDQHAHVKRVYTLHTH
jgi:hypothetical protein